MLAITLYIQSYTGGSSQCTKAWKRRKCHTDWRGNKAALIHRWLDLYVENLRESSDKNY